jgi:RNA polymerase sigma-70 factor (ECF subfamily)
MGVDPMEPDQSALAQAPGGDDPGLLRAFVQRGDRAALGALFSRHADAAYRFALRLSRNPADAEDILQGAFLEVFRRAHSFRGGSSVRTWILGFVLNLSRNKAREESRRRARQERAAAEADAIAPPATADPEVALQVRRALDDLPEHYRAPVWLHYGEGLSTDEVAAVLDLSPDTVRKQLTRGIDKLRNELLPMGAATSVLAVLPALAVETAPPALTASLLSTVPAAVGAKVGIASKIAAIAVTAIALTSSAAFVWWEGDAPPPEVAEIERRVREWQPTPEERRFDEIAWAGTIAEALRLSGDSGRPVVLLTQSGRINLGRSEGGSQFLRSRALADPDVIALLNSRFVPVYVSNVDYGELGSAPAPEKKLRDRIWREATEAKLHWGMDCLYLLEPGSGRLKDVLPLAKATIEAMRRWLEENAKTPPGAALAKPAPQSAAPAAPSGSLVLHLTARYLDAQGNVERERPDFHEVPAEDWLILSPEEWRQVVPPPKGTSRLDRRLAEELLTHVHPADMSINHDPNARNRLVVAELKATRVSRSWVLLEGRLEMQRSFTQVSVSEERPVTAVLKGFVHLKDGGGAVQSLQLISERATYGAKNFGVAVRSTP